MMSSSTLEHWKAENDAAQARIKALEMSLEQQAREIALAEERHRALLVERSTHLLQHLKQHAEEEAQKRALDGARKSVAALWERIETLMKRNAEIVCQQQRETALDEKQEAQRKLHSKMAAEVEMRAAYPGRLLETECDELVARLRLEDDARQRLEDEARQLAEEDARARRLADAAQAKAHAVRAQAVAAAQAADIGHALDTEEVGRSANPSVENAIL